MSPNAESLDPRALVRIRDLELRARTVVEGMNRGLHRSPLPGLSIEFSEYRAYTPGDDPKFLDWKRYARTDRLYVKRFEDETNLRCWFVVDASRSMAFASGSVSKFDYSRSVVATLSYLLLGRQDAVGLARFSDTLEKFIPAQCRPKQWQHVLSALAHEPTGSATDPVATLRRLTQLVNRRGLVIIVSDFLTDLKDLESTLAGLRGRGQDLLLMQLLDPAEVSLPQVEPYWVRDLETGKRISIDPKSVAAEYRRRFEAHQLRLDEIAKRLESDRFVVTTDNPLDEALAKILSVRSRRIAGKVLRRNRGGAR